MKDFFLFLFAIISNILIAQRDMKPGYILLNEGDTVYGQIDYEGAFYNLSYCYFIGEKNQTPITYKPGEIKAYRFIEGKYYISRQVKIENTEKTVFLEFLVNGKVDIFYMSDEIYFIEKEDQGLHILVNSEKKVYREGKEYIKDCNEYIGIMGAYMNDCPSLGKKINNSTLNQKSLIKISTEYHNRACPGEECIIYSKEPPTMILKTGLSAGCNFNEVQVYESNSNKNITDWSLGIMYGLQADIGNEGKFERFFISFGFYYSEVKHYFLLNKYVISKLELEYLSKNIMVDIDVNYIYPRYKIKPFIGIGVMFFKTLKESENQSSRINYNPEKIAIGPMFSIGTVGEINKRLSIKIEANYQFGIVSSSEDPYYPSNTNNLNFLLTFQYKLTKN